MATQLRLSSGYALSPMENSVGAPPPIIVTAPPVTGGLPPGAGQGGDGGTNPPSGNGPGSGTGASNGGNGYKTAGKSDAANAWADAHVRNQAQDAAGQSEYNHVHDMLADIYDYGTAHPGATLNIGNGYFITWQQVISDVAKTTIDIIEDTTLAGSRGAQNLPLGSQDFIFINPTDPNQKAYNSYGDSGTDFNILHEIGHELAFYSNYSSYAKGSYELNADNVAWSMENTFGIPPLPASAIGLK